MTKKHEELVEEIVRAVDKYGIPIDGTPTGGVFLEDAKAEMIVRLVLSAVRDGLPLPDEVGRWKWPTLKEPNEGITAWTGDMLRTGNEVFIALRKEE